MPSWHDGSTSSERLPEFNDIDYAPDTTEEPTFHGLAVGSGERCRVHNLEPVRCVAFEGTNTGRRFYLCSIENKLWEMYYSSNSGRIDDKLEHARFVEELVVEKNKIEKKYASLLVDVKKFAEETEKRVVERNYKLITSGAADEINELKKEVAELKRLRENTELRSLGQRRRNWRQEEKLGRQKLML
nr:uncharacterized protein LOC127334017 [Lolium perenne]